MAPRLRLAVLIAICVAYGACSDGPGKNAAPGTDTSVNNPIDMDTMLDMQAADAAKVADAARDTRVPRPDMNPADAAPDMSIVPVDMGMTMLPSGVCGNGIVETGETCEDCALDCDDQSVCTTDSIAGDPAVCLAYCRNDPFFDCVADDGCCPAGCTAAEDNDCSPTCGNLFFDPLETCDGDCPTDCDDQDPATRDFMTGSAANCSVECVHVPILLCVNGDGYCPAGCIGATDNDCPDECGNGVIEGGETCDPPESCPSCDDGNPCSTDNVTGSAATCDVVCNSAEIVACIDNDGCCGTRCRERDDNDCSPTCGNGQVDPGETCDGPQNCNQVTCNQGGACQTSIQTGHHQSCNVQCGYIDTTGCNNSDGCCPLGCTADTDNDCTPSCGNGVLEPGEYCDPPELCDTACIDDGDACTSGMYVGDAATCDGRCAISAIVACIDDDGCCSPLCSANDDNDCVPTCGNNVVEMGETCDGNCPNCNDGDACTVDIPLGVAGNCDLVCQNNPVTTCGPAEGCCPQGVGCNETIDPDCAPVCGNGVLETGETCEGNCPTSCNDNNVCTADALLGSSSTCDSSCLNTTITACASGDGCCPQGAGCNETIDSDCPPVCGNGVLETDELCDGNCPSSCNDNNACTADALLGSSSTCDASCRNTTITACVNGDGCCPTVCTTLTDTDC